MNCFYIIIFLFTFEVTISISTKVFFRLLIINIVGYSLILCVKSYIFVNKRIIAMKKKYEEVYNSEKLSVLEDEAGKSRIMNLRCPIYQTNFLTDAKQILSKGTYRAIKFIVKKIQDERIMLESYINNKETLKITIPREDILRWYPDEHSHRELKTAAEWLNNTDVNYETPEGWVKAKLVGEVNYNISTGMTIYITPGVLPLYYVVGSKFTMLDFAVTMSIQNKSATFFYDKCCKWRSYGIFSYTPTELSEALNVDLPTDLLKRRYITPADKEIKNLFHDGLIDFYFDAYEIRSGKGRGGKIDKFIFRIHDCIPGTAKDYTEQAHMRTYIIDTIKKTVPSMTSDNIFTQLKQLTRTELKDLYHEMKIFKEDVLHLKIKDARGILWFKLRNRYNINPNGDKRLIKNAQNEYPKYKKISEDIHATTDESSKTFNESYSKDEYTEYKETPKPEWYKYWEDVISFIVANKKCDGNPLSEKEQEIYQYLLHDEDKIAVQYDGENLTLTIEYSIYNNYIARPYQPLFYGLNEILIESCKTYFSNLKKITYITSVNGKDYSFIVYSD